MIARMRRLLGLDSEGELDIAEPGPGSRERPRLPHVYRSGRLGMVDSRRDALGERPLKSLGGPTSTVNSREGRRSKPRGRGRGYGRGRRRKK